MSVKIEDQVVSLDLAKRLKELNVPQVSLFYWVENFRGVQLCGEGNLGIERAIHPDSNRGDWSAFTSAELGEILQWKKLMIFGIPSELLGLLGENDTMANWYAKMLIYLIENNLLKL